MSTQLPKRRKAREMALQVLYACEQADDTDSALLCDHLSLESALDHHTRNYGRSLVEHTLGNRTKIDALIIKYAANWDLNRMAVIDRNILRMAIAELQFGDNVPYKVIIDEAVEIAKLYGTDDSGKFVNGLLDTIFKKELHTDDISSERTNP
jgi:N utilization substance protein B